MSHMRKMFYAAALASAAAAGCSKSDPPCPAGVLDVGVLEADEGLVRRAKKEAIGGRGEDTAGKFNCGHAPNGDGAYKDIGQTQLSFFDVLYCAQEIATGAQSGSLSLCLERLARGKFTNQMLGMNAPDMIVINYASKVDCVEGWRAAEVKADKHSLSRVGADEWVPAVLWGAAQLADKMAGAATATATAPALFVIRLAAGEEQTCYDTPSGPSKGCLDMDGCGGAPPGATVPGSSTGTGDVIPPGTDPGVPPGGDHL